MMDTKTILAGLILAVAVAAALNPSPVANYEYTFDPALTVWTNAAGEQINMKALTCNYSKISETARTVKFGNYKENVWAVSNSNIMISVVGENSKTLASYIITIDDKNKASIKEVK